LFTQAQDAVMLRQPCTRQMPAASSHKDSSHSLKMEAPDKVEEEEAEEEYDDEDEYENDAEEDEDVEEGDNADEEDEGGIDQTDGAWIWRKYEKPGTGESFACRPQSNGVGKGIEESFAIEGQCQKMHSVCQVERNVEVFECIVQMDGSGEGEEDSSLNHLPASLLHLSSMLSPSAGQRAVAGMLAPPGGLAGVAALQQQQQQQQLPINAFLASLAQQAQAHAQSQQQGTPHLQALLAQSGHLQQMAQSGQQQQLQQLAMALAQHHEHARAHLPNLAISHRNDVRILPPSLPPSLHSGSIQTP